MRGPIRRDPRVLLIEEPGSSSEFEGGLTGEHSLPGIELERITIGQRAIRRLDERQYDLVLFSPGAGKVDGLTFLQDLRAQRSDTPVVVLSETNNAREAVEAMKLGAADYLVREAVSPGILSEKIFDVLAQLEGERSSSEEIHILRQLSFTDSLTGLFNRRYLFQAINREMNRSERSGSPLSFAMVDLDLFKSINDRHGHLAGDSILCRFALYLRSWVRTMDIVCRYGGDEFGIILPRTDSRKAIEVSRRLCSKLAQAIFPSEGLRLRISVSVGVSSSEMNPSWQGIDLIRFADKALLRAKQQGRNQILLWDGAIEAATAQ